jgi:hypothetical protein
MLPNLPQPTCSALRAIMPSWMVTNVQRAGAFLDSHGYDLSADNGTLYEFVMGVASGEIGEAQIIQFFRDHMIPLGTS